MNRFTYKIDFKIEYPVGLCSKLAYLLYIIAAEGWLVETDFSIKSTFCSLLWYIMYNKVLNKLTKY